MSTNIKILSPTEINSFDQPPATINAYQRKQFFRPSKAVLEIVTSFRSPTNKVGFILHYGYFKLTNRFFTAKEFLQSEISFVCNDLNIPSESINLTEYDETTLERHQKKILELLGVAPFIEETKQLLLNEASSLCSRQLKPQTIFGSLVDFLNEKKIELPSYFVLANIITTALNQYEANLIASLDKVITPQEKSLLDNLLKGTDNNSKLLSYKLTSLKNTSHSLKPTGIKENIGDLLYFKNLFKQLEHIIDHLNLDIQATQYYAGIVIKSQTFQLIRREDNKYLLLICFIVHQYFILNDLLIEALIHSSQSAKNAAFKKHRDNYYQQRQQKEMFVDKAFKSSMSLSLMLKDIRDISFKTELTSDERINLIQALFHERDASRADGIEDEIKKFENEYKRLRKESYHDILESFSLKLQARVSEIIKHVCFDQDSSDQNILEAIDYYKVKDGALSKDAPIGFLNEEQQANLVDNKNKWRISLYKVFLVHEIAGSLKSGALNLLHSYKFRSFDKYLISKKVWVEDKDNLLKRAGLAEFTDAHKILTSLDKIIQETFQLVNKRILNGENPFVRFDQYEHMIVTTPPAKEKEASETQVMDLFPQDRFISLFEILSTVNNVTSYVNKFEHWKIKKHWGRPENKTFFAGIIGLGCNLGIKKLARISSNINPNSLESTVNWYFSEENLNTANNKILGIIEQLSLPRIFQKDVSLIHTSSDGQKFGIGVDSLHANHSFKYFGKGKGVSSYTFIDDKHRLFYSTVISPSEREAAYVIDGLLQNDVVESDIHSTDTHGYTEIVFAVTHLLGISFAPRIKDFRDQRLFSFDARTIYKNMGYKIIPDEKIDMQSIEREWDNILRFVATIKLKHSTASQLFQRLSHYSRQHPLYRAIKSLGKIIKTIFLLRYIDDVGLRQDIEKQLNKTESIHKFAKAVFFGNNQEFQQQSKEDQLRTDACKRLIENTIICWNYLYLSDLISKTDDVFERQRLIKIIRNGSVVVWQHINLQGEYDFTDDALKNSLTFSLPKLIDLDIT